MSIGRRIQEQRRKNKMTQEQLSEKLGISKNHLSAIERGIYRVQIDTLVMIMNCLGCTADDLFRDVIDRGYAPPPSCGKGRKSFLPRNRAEFLRLWIHWSKARENKRKIKIRRYADLLRTVGFYRVHGLIAFFLRHPKFAKTFRQQRILCRTGIRRRCRTV